MGLGVGGWKTRKKKESTDEAVRKGIGEMMQRRSDRQRERGMAGLRD